MIPSDDDLRRIARRVLGLIAYRSDDSPGGVYYPSCSVSGIADTIDAQAAAILREELEKMFTSVTAFDWIQSDGEVIDDPFATVVHTTDY